MMKSYFAIIVHISKRSFKIICMLSVVNDERAKSQNKKKSADEVSDALNIFMKKKLLSQKFKNSNDIITLNIFLFQKIDVLESALSSVRNK